MSVFDPVSIAAMGPLLMGLAAVIWALRRKP